MKSTILTVGHSNRSLQEFIDLLQSHYVQRVVDIRTVPGSRHNPHFNQKPLADSLRDRGIDYHHKKQLGGFRKAAPDSPNRGWRTKGFRGFADYMLSEEFQGSLQDLIDLSGDKPTAIMCAEAVPWRCHRSLIADALVVRGVRVKHIVGGGDTRIHQLNAMARVSGGRLTYPE